MTEGSIRTVVQPEVWASKRIGDLSPSSSLAIRIRAALPRLAVNQPTDTASTHPRNEPATHHRSDERVRLLRPCLHPHYESPVPRRRMPCRCRTLQTSSNSGDHQSCHQSTPARGTCTEQLDRPCLIRLDRFRLPAQRLGSCSASYLQTNTRRNPVAHHLDSPS